MGTLFDQRVKDCPDIEHEAEVIAKSAKEISRVQKITIDQALRCIELACMVSRERQENVFQNSLDEQLAGIGLLWQQTNEILEKEDE